jgi:PAS domain S-box-containing protein
MRNEEQLEVSKTQGNPAQRGLNSGSNVSKLDPAPSMCVSCAKDAERVQLALRGNNDGIWDWNPITNEVFFSTRWKDMIGYEDSEISNHLDEWSSRVHPEDIDDVMQALQDHFDHKTTFYSSEHRMRCKDGRYKWILDRAQAIRDETGKVVRVVGSHTDITERKLLEAELRDAHIQLESALAAGSVYTWRWNLPENRLTVNRSLAQLFGIDPDAAALGLPYETFLEPIHPDDRPHVVTALEHAISTGENYATEFRVRNAAGVYRWVIARGQVEYDAKGKAITFPGALADITERKRSEEHLQHQEQKYRFIFETIGVSIWEEDFSQVKLQIDKLRAKGVQDFRTYFAENPKVVLRLLRKVKAVKVNAASLLLFGAQNAEELLGALDQLFLPETMPVFVEELIAIAEGRAYLEAETVLQTLEGRRLNVLFSTTFSTTKTALDSVLVSIVDISDRKRAEAALCQSEEFKNRMLESSLDCIKVLDLDGRLLYMNTGGLCVMEIDDFTPFVQTEWLCFWEGSDRYQAEQALTTAKAGQVSIFRGFCPTAKGTPKWWEVIVSPMMNAAGQVEQILSMSRDITDRVQTERRLQESEAKLKLSYKATRSELWDWDLTCNIAQVSENDFGLFGFEPTTQEVSYEQWLSRLHPEDRASAIEAFHRMVKHRQEYYEVEYRILHPLGIRWLASRGQFFYDEIGNAVRRLGNVQDITDRKEAEIERDRMFVQEQAARVEAERANRIKDEFMAVLSHELRSPLNPILGWTKLMQSRNFDASQVENALAAIERNAKTQIQLIDDLLDVAKILRGKLNLTVTPLNLAFIVDSAIETVRTAAIAKSIHLNLEIPAIGQVNGDSARLQQVVWNLLSNAIKFTPNHGRVDVRLERVEHWAQLTVQDTGKGIDPDFLSHIFETFRQEDASTTRKFGGLGLGLAIVYALVEAHGGTITADSQGAGKGSTFIVQLPLLDAEPEVSQSCEFSEQELDLAGVRVLMVDDEADARALFAAMLSQYGAEVLVVSCVAEVLAALDSFRPDILVSDIGMPEMDGYELIQQIRKLPTERGGRISAIALTAYASETDQQQALTAGFQSHLSKPVDPFELVTEVSRLTQLSEAVEQ